MRLVLVIEAVVVYRTRAGSCVAPAAPAGHQSLVDVAFEMAAGESGRLELDVRPAVAYAQTGNLWLSSRVAM